MGRFSNPIARARSSILSEPSYISPIFPCNGPSAEADRSANFTSPTVWAPPSVIPGFEWSPSDPGGARRNVKSSDRFGNHGQADAAGFAGEEFRHQQTVLCRSRFSNPDAK